jgi:simple sugar transport system permease protein
MSEIQFIAVVGASWAATILIAALGELLVQRAGVVNIGIEGVMLTGAFAAFVGSSLTGSAWMGLACGIAAGAAGGALFALLTVAWNADQIVSGLGMNLLALGVTGVFFRRLGRPAVYGRFEPLEIPLLSEIPVLGPLLFRHHPAVYLAAVLVLAVWWLLYRTWWGLAIRAVGEHPRAADTAGVPVKWLQAACVITGGALAGLAGCNLTIGYSNTFTEGLTSGRGFVALAVVVFGKWRPIPIALGALLFGLAGALGDLLNAQGFPTAYQFLQMLPYLLTILVLAGVVGRATPPAHLALPYRREDA